MTINWQSIPTGRLCIILFVKVNYFTFRYFRNASKLILIEEFKNKFGEIVWNESAVEKRIHLMMNIVSFLKKKCYITILNWILQQVTVFFDDDGRIDKNIPVHVDCNILGAVRKLLRTVSLSVAAKLTVYECVLVLILIRISKYWVCSKIIRCIQRFGENKL